MAARRSTNARAASGTKDELAAACWQRMWAFFVAHRDHYVKLAFDHGLTPPHMNALLSLDPGQAQPMRALAEQWRCDASNVTWLVDRLEERGLVERQPAPGDRRVKAVRLTAAGEKLRDKLNDELFQEAPPELLELSKAELTELHGYLSELAPPLSPGELNQRHPIAVPHGRFSPPHNAC